MKPEYERWLTRCANTSETPPAAVPRPAASCSSVMRAGCPKRAILKVAVASDFIAHADEVDQAPDSSRPNGKMICMRRAE